MNHTKQKRYFLSLYTGTAVFFVLCVSTIFVSAQVSHSFGQIPIGNSDKNGFARIDKVFHHMLLGDGRKAELFFRFSSDPRLELRYLGAFWTIPFFDSKVVKISGNRYTWESPNSGVYTFNKLPKSDKGYKETYILNTTGKWKLNVAKDESIYIGKVNDARNRYLFKNGRLVSFCTGKDADTFRITYGNKGIPKSIYNVSKNLKEMEFAYNKEGFLTKIVFPENKKALFITYGKCDTFAEDGTTKQGDLLKSISSIAFADGKKEEYKYSAEAKKKNRKILTKKEAERASANVSINKFEQKTREDNNGFIEWDATTGIIVSDSGGEYAVRNPIFDKYSTEYGDDYFVTSRKREMKTKESQISYKKPENKYAEVWDYSLRTAVKIVQNPHTGEQTRISYIGTFGNSSMKVRKVEKKFVCEKDWQVLFINSYNESGKLVRRLYENGDIQEMCYIDVNEYSYETKKVNGVLVQSRKINKRTQDEEVSLYEENGDVLSFYYTKKKASNALFHKKNGVLIYHKEYSRNWDEDYLTYLKDEMGNEYFFERGKLILNRSVNKFHVDEL